MNRLKLLAVAGLSALALSACTGDKNLAAKDPVTAAKDLSVALRDNDANRFSHIMVPPDDYAKLEARFKEEAAKKPAPTAEDEAQFKANVVDKYTASDAETTLFAELQPKLAQYGPQLPGFAAMGGAALGQAIDQNDKLSKSDKDQAKAVLTAIVKWTGTAHLDDPDKAKQAIHVVVTTARDLKLTTLADMQKLSLPETLDKMGTAFGGLRKTLAVYGFDTDKMLDSVKVEKKSGDDNNAVVTVSYTILDTPVTGDIDMIQRDGRWYSAVLVKSVEDSLAKPADDGATPIAGPATPPTPPTQDANPPVAAPPANDPSAAPAAPAAPASAEPAPASPASAASNGGG